MLSNDQIQAAVDRLVKAAHAPSQVILFGSYARGEADEKSDVDLLVIEEDVPADPGEEWMRLCDAVGRLAPGVGLDLLLHTRQAFERRSQVPGTVLHSARKEGKVLFDVTSR